MHNYSDIVIFLSNKIYYVSYLKANIRNIFNLYYLLLKCILNYNFHFSVAEESFRFRKLVADFS